MAAYEVVAEDGSDCMLLILDFAAPNPISKNLLVYLFSKNFPRGFYFDISVGKSAKAELTNITRVVQGWNCNRACFPREKDSKDQ